MEARKAAAGDNDADAMAEKIKRRRELQKNVSSSAKMSRWD
jgi:hypothetical protein